MRSVAAVLLLAAISSGCAAVGEDSSDTPGTIPSGQTSLAPTTHPTGTPSVAPETPTPSVHAAFSADDIAEVITNNLVVRSLPEISDESIIDPTLLSEGDLLFVLRGPLSADGYDWYLVQSFERNQCVDLCPRDDWPFGWVAANGKDGEPWIAPGILECPQAEVEGIGWLSNVARLACFGDETLVLPAQLGDCYAAETPVALQQYGCSVLAEDYVPPGPGEGTFSYLLMIRPDSGVEIPPGGPGTPIVVTGHFDDADASACKWSESFNDEAGNPDAEPPPAEQVVLWCRAEFVATDIAVAPSR